MNQSLSIQKWVFQNVYVISNDEIRSTMILCIINQPITVILIVCDSNFYCIIVLLFGIEVILLFGGGSHSLTPTSHPGWFARDHVILNRVGWVLLQFILCGSCQTQSNNYCGRLFPAFRHSKWLSYSTSCQLSGEVIWKCIDHMKIISIL